MLELDFWLPELSLAIEVQDFTTHSRTTENELAEYSFSKEKGIFKSGPSYHKRKRALAKEQLGLELIELWEDEIRLGDAAISEILQKRLEAPKLQELQA